MSLKSFDKFCENMINADKNAAYEKEVFDERQKIMRSQLGIESFSVFAAAALICCFSMDFVCKWAESITAIIAMLGVLSMLWFLIRCAVKGCMVAASGKQIQKTSVVMTIVVAALNLVRYVADLCKGEPFIKDNMFTNELLFMICFILMMICGIFSLCVIHRENKLTKARYRDEP